MKKHERLMVLGRPGAGKTTFLKQVATVTMSQLLNSENLDQEQLPIYIPLKNFSEARDHETLIETIQEKAKGIDIQLLLERGQCIVLIDALDEVITKEVNRVYTDIERLINKYPKNRFVVTCRNAARDYLLNNFTLVEIAEFNNEQIDKFVKQWFQSESKTGDRFLTSIHDSSNKAVLELAGTPLMLTILCLTFDAKYGLASNRYALYRDIVDVLSRRWDASRRIPREKQYADALTQERLLDMLAEIAYNGFTKKQPQYFWKRWDLEEEIACFSQQIFAFETENKSIASAIVLNEIEANTGIFIEEAKDTYKFAHLTFQEYFTARHISLSGDGKFLKSIVDKYLADPQWKEVFRVIPGRLRKADEFFLDVFWKINEIGRNLGIKKLLERLDDVTRKHGVSSSSGRSMYLAVVRNTYYVAEHRVIVNYPCARRLAVGIRELDKKRKQDTLPTPSSLATTYLLILHYSVYQQITNNVEYLKENGISDSTDPEIIIFFEQSSQECFEIAIEQSKDINVELAEVLIDLKSTLPEYNSSKLEQEKWLDRLLHTMKDLLDIGHLFDLSADDTKALNDYLYTCSILVDCIGGDSIVSPKLRNQIINNLLLPVDEIPSELLNG